MSYNPDIHKRKSIRLKGYDYSKNGAYFITICCHDNLCRFGKIENKKIILNKYGKIAHNEWKKLSSRFQNIKTDIFQIMPNHFHAILVLENNNVGVGLAPTLVKNNINVSIFQSGQPQGIAPTTESTTVGNIIGTYKSLVANNCLKIHKSKNEIMGKLWQRNYHEHIIRNEKSLEKIYHYILHNPEKWKDDIFFRK